MKLVIARSALQDLKDIKAYYLDQGVPAVGLKFVSTILQKMQLLPDHPLSGREVPEFGQEQIRELIYPPFRIVYMVQISKVSQISVVRVWRSERLLNLAEDET
ncbi:toxin, RelE family protein [Arsukibacterium ikkense]|uniref:Toxin, RelE family protein n=1 Tax=Arsukibacterium ikkense TaxID=336831 RepID=A0A0M2V0H2_9GAMM|nr:type II toxin-antitoxin system RelE/ParE family toxin [Arsukibacterium ikkense]KKO43874.1 toxin, RelE family protein [Arsukibacterium ikkense]